MAYLICNRICLTMMIVHCACSSPYNELVEENNDIKKIYFKKSLDVGKREAKMAPQLGSQISPPEEHIPLPEEPGPIIDPVPAFNFRLCCNIPVGNCDRSSAYRTIDGTCNNLDNPCWGSAGIEYRRLLSPRYEDGFDSPRGFGRFPPLPRSRDVSVAMTETIIPSNPDAITLMVMQWGQFIDHDMVLTPNDADKGSIYFGKSCCENFRSHLSSNPSCRPIDVTGDPFYEKFGVTCLPFIRSTASLCGGRVALDPIGPVDIIGFEPLPSLLAQADKRALAPEPAEAAVMKEKLDSNQRFLIERQQINDVSSFLDASLVYGSSFSAMTELRKPNSYELKDGPGNEGETCPNSAALKTSSINNVCPLNFLPVRNNFDSGNEEFFAGDERVEEQPGLTSIHTLFVRMHNHCGRQIEINNPGLPLEEIFQKARKIVGAMMQLITYNEFLPIVLGEAIMGTHRLNLQSESSNYSHDYNKNIDASAHNVFAAAAFRFGHSLIKDKYTLPGNILVNLSESFNNHKRTTIPGTFPSHFLRGISIDPSEEMDHILVDAIHNKLLAVSPFLFGSDLYARNIERAREHGLPGYKGWYHFCGGLANNFSDLNKLEVMPTKVVERLQKLYGGRLKDVDLFPAAIAENNLKGSLLGPTFACILTEHFKRLKFGDRFWFENPDVFTVDQLKSIRKTKLSTLLCKYTDAKEVQKFVMLPDSASNPLQNCSTILKEGLLNDISLFR